jgi:hypothetical protein
MHRHVLALVTVLAAAHGTASAAHICWVENAADVGGAVHVVLRKGSEGVARGFRRLDGSRVDAAALASGAFDLKVGEEILLSQSPHDSCLASAVIRDGRVGLALKASFCPPGLGCSHAEQFVSDEPLPAAPTPPTSQSAP